MHLSHGKSAARSCRCIFRIIGVSSAGGHGCTLLPHCHSERTNRFIISAPTPRRQSGRAQIGTFSLQLKGGGWCYSCLHWKVNWNVCCMGCSYCFHSEVTNGMARGGEDFSKSSFGSAKRKTMYHCVFHSTLGLLCLNSRLHRKEKLINAHAGEMPIASIARPPIGNGWWNPSLVMSCWSTSRRPIHQSVPTHETVHQLALFPTHMCTCACSDQLVFKMIYNLALIWDQFFSQSHHAWNIFPFYWQAQRDGGFTYPIEARDRWGAIFSSLIMEFTCQPIDDS